MPRRGVVCVSDCYICVCGCLCIQRSALMCNYLMNYCVSFFNKEYFPNNVPRSYACVYFFAFCSLSNNILLNNYRNKLFPN